MTVCVLISFISQGRQRLCPQGPAVPARGQQGPRDRDHVPGMELDHKDPVQRWEWQLGVLEQGQSAVTSSLSLGANEPTCRNVSCYEEGKPEVTVRMRFEHSGDGAVQGVHLYPTKHFGMCPLCHQTSPVGLTEV